MLSSIPWWGWLLLTIAFLITLARPILTSPVFLGDAGEKRVSGWIKSQLDPQQYILIENITLPIQKGMLQIDHVIISPYGVFVIETKTIHGLIFGEATQSTWTQQIYEQKKQFQNPLRQNSKHVKAVADLLGVSTNEVYSIVVFVGDNEFKTAMPEGVFQGQRFIQFIKSKNVQVYGNTETITYLVNKLQEGRINPSKQANQVQIDDVGTLQGDVQKQTSPLKPAFLLILLAAAIGAAVYFYKGSEGLFKNSFEIKPSMEPGVESDLEVTTDVDRPPMKSITLANPENLELELAKQACNTAIAKALYDSSAGVAEKRDKLCAEYQRMQSRK